MKLMTKAQRLGIEERARAAMSRQLSCRAVSKKLAVGRGGPIHEFDIFCAGVVIGGVTTGRRKTSKGNWNVSSCDRACAELLWLSLWPGEESRVHVLSDRSLAEWLLGRFASAPFSRTINVYYYDESGDSLSYLGSIGAKGRECRVPSPDRVASEDAVGSRPE